MKILDTIKTNENVKYYSKQCVIMIFIALLSLVFGKISFAVPGVEGVTSTFHEVFLLLSVLYLPTYGFTLGVVIISSLVTPPEGSYLSTVIFHQIAVTFIWVVYYRYLIHIKSVLKSALVWIVSCLVYYYILMIPVMTLTYCLFGLITYEEMGSFFKTVIIAISLEAAVNTSITTLYVCIVTIKNTLEQQVEWMNIVIEGGNVGLWNWDLETNKKTYNEQWAAMLGYSLDDIKRRHVIWDDMVHPDDRAHVFYQLDAFKKGVIPVYNTEYRLKGEDGMFRWIQDTGRAIKRNSAGEPLKATGIHLDVTEVKKYKLEAESEKEKLAVILGTLPDGVVTLDLSGNVTYMNSSAEKMLELSRGEGIGLPLNTLYRIKGDSGPVAQPDSAERCLDSGRVESSDRPGYLFEKTGRKRLISDIATPLYDSSGEMFGVVLVFRDVTEESENEKELLKVRKLESLGVLAGGIAHDFNNLLTGFFGNISLASHKIESGHPALKYLDSANDALTRASDLTNQLLTFAKGGELLKELTDLELLIKETITFTLRGSKVKFDFMADENLFKVNADKGQISQVITNLTINAIHAMPEGGLLKVKMENSQKRESDRLMNMLKITVSDEGCGISSENIEKIFDPYFTTKDTGNGLGLASVFSIIKKHNGIITVTSDVNRGTAFVIYLPAENQ